LNEGLATVRKAIARFFDLRHRDDLLFLYFSGHGVRDEQGHLYLAVRDTERAILAGTAIEASFVTARMDRSASKRLVLVLDCCHSGAFGYGAKAAQGAAVGTATVFEARLPNRRRASGRSVNKATSSSRRTRMRVEPSCRLGSKKRWPASFQACVWKPCASWRTSFVAVIRRV
jgi:Caspase domain